MEQETKKCPQCAEDILKDAIFCKHCKSSLNESATTQTPIDSMSVKKSLSTHQLQLFQIEYEKEKKKTGIAYVLWFFFGSIGAHQFYLGNKDTGTVLAISFLILLFTPAFAGNETAALVLVPIAGGVIILKLLADLFTLGKQTKKANESIEKRVLAQVSR